MQGEIHLHLFLTTAPDGGEWSAYGLAALSWQKEAVYLLNGRLSGPQGWSGVMGQRTGEEELLFCCWEQNPTSSSPEPSHYTSQTVSAPGSVFLICYHY